MCREPAGGRQAHEHELNYVAASPVADDAHPVPEGMAVYEIPAGRYAVFDSSLRAEAVTSSGTWASPASEAFRPGARKRTQYA